MSIIRNKRHFVPTIPPGVEVSNPSGILSWSHSRSPVREPKGKTLRPSEVEQLKSKVTYFSRVFDLSCPDDLKAYNLLMSAFRSQSVKVHFVDRRLMEKTLLYKSGKKEITYSYTIFVEYSFVEKVIENGR